ncbi:ribose 1,5-bisphosphokinase [Pseudomonas palleroniana]|uniref:Ribose 1,5-bisphosphate phosphokinase PhnN n=2 Tax=Pseudomonas palleroniana TaxID=191390 RepID=A0A1H5FXX3_9PSED|nr:ribose 1,5-bisphosphokinase [Pseudomonas palleroniana]
MIMPMGAPNWVRGGSHSGNVAAAGLAAGGLLGILSSDYQASLATSEEGVLMAGRLIYLIGPSGSGKDSLLEAARPRLLERGCRIVRRVITRSAEAVGEAAQGVSPQQFAAMQDEGAFALSWQANGLSYGIPRDIDVWLAAGEDVLVNGSRAHLAQTRERYPTSLVLLLTVDQAVLRERLIARGRESLADIEERLARNARFTAELIAGNGAGLFVLDNSGPLEHTVERLLCCLDHGDAACA